MIDSHVHFRNFEKTDKPYMNNLKETVSHGLEVAKDSGLEAVIDMPNTNPPIISRDLVVKRIELAEKAGVPEVFYALNIGLTSNPLQIAEAVDIYNEFHPKISGMKLFAGKSVGNLSVPSLNSQRIVYQTLADNKYNGVLVVHAEKEGLFYSDRWNPKDPISHCYARPETAEIESVKDQIMLAKETGFKGKLHITHTSSPESVNLVSKAKEYLDISCGVTPHHLFYDWNQLKSNNGILWKMNPPLRSPESRNSLLHQLLRDKINIIETDHAPHMYNEKISSPFMSGIPGLPWWPLFVDYLEHLGVSSNDIEKLTFKSAKERFDLPVDHKEMEYIDHRNEYSFNPYENLEALFKK